MLFRSRDLQTTVETKNEAIKVHVIDMRLVWFELGFLFALCFFVCVVHFCLRFVFLFAFCTFLLASCFFACVFFFCLAMCSFLLAFSFFL